ncbi:hypothetical protein SAMN05878494_2711 [Bacillus cereus]|nr:hypothetical protein SAMN05878494_2711 [Bacillus cereus]
MTFAIAEALIYFFFSEIKVITLKFDTIKNRTVIAIELNISMFLTWFK